MLSAAEVGSSTGSEKEAPFTIACLCQVTGILEDVAIRSYHIKWMPLQRGLVSTWQIALFLENHREVHVKPKKVGNSCDDAKR